MFDFNDFITSGKSWVSWIIDKFIGASRSRSSLTDQPIGDGTTNEKWPVWFQNRCSESFHYKRSGSSIEVQIENHKYLLTRPLLWSNHKPLFITPVISKNSKNHRSTWSFPATQPRINLQRLPLFPDDFRFRIIHCH